MQITTENTVGIGRRNRNSKKWVNLNLSPNFVSQNYDLEQAEYFDINLQQKLKGVGGCIATHRNAWSQICSLGEGFYLITEDDAVPSINFLQKIEEIANELRNEDVGSITLTTIKLHPKHLPTLIQLGWSVNRYFSTRQLMASIKHLIVFRGRAKNSYVRKFSYGTHCYLLNKEMAQFLLANISSYSIPLDVQFIMLSQNLDFASLCIVRTLENYSYQERIDSNIESRILTDTNPSSASIRIQSLANANCPRQESITK